ncbi:2OG-Fe(II) oxygenase [Streptomyces sp. NPDC048483]|uniref:2OG-Fe(II) oxygenase n=1 Tax=Streptomyces sp. NPDC048483 TaxID=3154927 RepID=UPI00342596A8
MQSQMSALVDLETYPVDALDDEPGLALLNRVRAEFDQTSLAVLDGFLRPEAVTQVAARAREDAETLGYRFTGVNNVFLGTSADAGRASDPTDRGGASDPADVGRAHTKSTLAYDRIGTHSPLKALFQWEPLLGFVSAAVGRPVFRSADPLGAMTVHVHHDGDEQDWHFDVSEYTIVLHLLAPEAGGVLEYVPRSRTAVEQDRDTLRAIADGERHELTRELPTTPGTFVLHSGRISLHRVTPVHGATPRISATLSFNSAPDGRLNDYTRNLYFGRTQ